MLWYDNLSYSVKAQIILRYTFVFRNRYGCYWVYIKRFIPLFLFYFSHRGFFHISFHRRVFTYSVNRYYSPSHRQCDRYWVIGGVYRPVDITNSILEPSGHHSWKLGNVIILIREKTFSPSTRFDFRNKIIFYVTITMSSLWSVDLGVGKSFSYTV